ncbi:nitroreductase family protein [Acetobacteroides hydrogenigenes]|uniref:Nitroreductase n=1 Tax=Acetobacteroides hydrogenigenes TaxID=979970 RepID=A0A4R2ECJ7_9BACT|nr:nitroreductase family protein [Acetobacteroides hydrogenigenes]TCN65695.1 nitroreductase [Acetobacteroides hydrogenigenes]
MNNTIKCILERKSVRQYSKQAIERETIELLVRAAMAAPSAKNRQPWTFIAITQKGMLIQLSDGLPYAKMVKDAPCAIIVCGDLSRTKEEDKNKWVVDCSAATENLLLAAESLGLGAVWTGVYPDTDRVEFVSKCLNLPDFVIPLNVIPVGHPSGENKPKDKFKPELLKWERWE